MKTIIAPIDFSRATDSVVESAISLALGLEGRLVLLHVVQPLIITSDYGLTMDNFQDTVTASEKYTAKHLADLHAMLHSKGVKHFETVQVSGPARTRIVEQARKHNADYIVMGSHGHSAFYDLMIGSTTQYVVQKAHCPVVIVPRIK